MSYPSRLTRSSQKSAAGDTFLSITRATSVVSTPRTARQSASPSPQFSEHSVADPDPVMTPILEAGESDSRETTPAKPEDNQSPDPDQPDTQSEPNLARSLELLATKISALPGPQAPKSTIKPRVPDVFDGSDSSKLDTFIFQCTMYISARSADFPDVESQVLFAVSYLKGNALDWFQMELSDRITANTP